LFQSNKSVILFEKMECNMPFSQIISKIDLPSQTIGIREKLENPQKILGYMGERCLVVKHIDGIHFVDLATANVFTPKPIGLKGSLSFARALEKGEMALVDESDRLERTTDQRLVFRRLRDQSLTIIPLNRGESVIEAASEKVVHAVREGNHFFWAPNGTQERVEEKFFGAEEGEFLESFACKEFFYATVLTDKGVVLKEYHLSEREEGEVTRFDVESQDLSLMVKPERIIPLKDSFLIVSYEDFEAGLIENELRVTAFYRTKEGALTLKTFFPAPEIPFLTLNPLAHSPSDIFYQSGANKWTVCRFLMDDKGERTVKPIFNGSAFAAAADFSGLNLSIAFIAHPEEGRTTVRVYQCSKDSFFNPKEYLEKTPLQTLNTVASFGGGYFGLGLDDNKTKDGLFFFKPVGATLFSQVGIVNGGSCSFFAGKNGCYHWIETKLKKVANLPLVTETLYTAVVKEHFKGSFASSAAAASGGKGVFPLDLTKSAGNIKRQVQRHTKKLRSLAAQKRAEAEALEKKKKGK
jgi:hypothetical protein